MRDVNEVTRQVLAGEDITEVLTGVSERAQALVTASAAWVVAPDESNPDRLWVRAAAGRGAESLLGAFWMQRRACQLGRCGPANQ